MELSDSLIRSLPKAELHCHLDGSLRVATILELAKVQNIELPYDTEGELTDFLQVDDHCESLEDYLKAFPIINQVLQTEQALEQVTFELAEDATSENIRLLEIRFSPVLHTYGGLSLETVLSAVLKGKEQAEKTFNIQIGIIISSIRSISPEVSLELAQLTVNYKDKGVVGFDLAGAEENFPAKDHKEAFFHIINNNINTTVHAGEAYGAESIHQAIHYTRANRIGHGTRLREDMDLFRYVLDHRIPLEMCVTCNVQTQCVNGYDDHPIKDYLDAGIRVTVNTDNRLISNTSLTNEYIKIVKHYNLSISELKKLILNGFTAGFLPYEERKELVEEIRLNLEEMLANS
ncbi:MAG: adenosine deaminase [Flavobacteriales bacterium]|nr:adenosine deaminase [Flavobacteriales bacterium]